MCIWMQAGEAGLNVRMFLDVNTQQKGLTFKNTAFFSKIGISQEEFRQRNNGQLL